MPHSINYSKARMVRNMILMLKSVEVGRGLSGIGFQYFLDANCSEIQIAKDMTLILQSAE
jgi:GH35 family endo-1,4-beta-xylanase